MFAKKKGRTRRAGLPVHDDLVQTVFTADAANQLWLTDITEHPTAEGKLYLCTIKGHALRPDRGLLDRLTHDRVVSVSALRNAIALREPAGTVVHSGRGSQFGPENS